MASRKITVLGGGGFIGAHVTRALHLRGDDVTVFGRSLDTSRLPAEVRLVTGALEDRAKLMEAMSDADVVCHFISSTVPSTSNADPVGDVTSNLLGSLSVLQCMHALGLKRIIYLSSGGTVYGEPVSLPVGEDHPLRPQCSYGVVKVAVERYLEMYEILWGLEPTILRPSNPYGPGQTHSGVQGLVSTVLRNVATSREIAVWGDGTVTRDYIYIDDLVSLVLAAIDKPAMGIFNAGSGEGHTVDDIVRISKEVTGVDFPITHKPGRAYDIKSIVLDIHKAREKFDWAPKIGLRDGIARTWRDIHVV